MGWRFTGPVIQWQDVVVFAIVVAVSIPAGLWLVLRVLNAIDRWWHGPPG